MFKVIIDLRKAYVVEGIGASLGVLVMNLNDELWSLKFKIIFAEGTNFLRFYIVFFYLEC
jgi:hypothetical protein